MPKRCRYPIPGSVQGWIGWGFEQPDLVEGVPAHVKFNAPSNTNHSMILLCEELDSNHREYSALQQHHQLAESQAALK